MRARRIGIGLHVDEALLVPRCVVETAASLVILGLVDRCMLARL